LEVLDIACLRVGLATSSCWIVVDEYNYDVAERSWNIEPKGKPLGRFNIAFLMRLAAAFGRNSGRRVNRTE